LKKAEVKIIGSGVSGLTTALVLQECGYTVSIISGDHYKDTVSANAAAIWFPYEARPIEKVINWSYQSYKKFKKLAEDPKSGVSIVPFKIIEPVDITPFWISALPGDSKLNKETIKHLGSEFVCYSYSIPLIETQIYLPYLHDTFLNNGGSIQYQKITNIESLSENLLVINCSGLGSKELFKDKELYPIQGQTVKIEPNEDIIGVAFDEFPRESETEITYLIPRSDCIVLGGSAIKNNFTNVVDKKLTERIINRCSTLESEIESKKVLSTHVGLRPGRTQIRLEHESETSVIHNYGHGGAGFTVSWGCAFDVLDLVQKHYKNE
jgi:D-amino-acid oxidase